MDDMQARLDDLIGCLIGAEEITGSRHACRVRAEDAMIAEPQS